MCACVCVCVCVWQRRRNEWASLESQWVYVKYNAKWHWWNTPASLYMYNIYLVVLYFTYEYMHTHNIHCIYSANVEIWTRNMCVLEFLFS